jgi:hypothetical protein
MESSTRTHQQYSKNSLFQCPKTPEIKHDFIIPIILLQSYQKDYTTLTDETQIKKLYFFNKKSTLTMATWHHTNHRQFAPTKMTPPYRYEYGII